MRSIAAHLAAWAAMAYMGIAGSVQAQVADTPVAVRHIADSGAAELALDYVDRSQPKHSSAAGWAEWENLRLELLVRQGRDADIVARAKSYSPALVSGPAFVELAPRAARAAVNSSEPVQGRRWLGQAFLATGGRSELGDSEYRAARQLVIEAYLAEGRAEAAYSAMLRFQQDFAPLRLDEAERFVGGLSSLERYSEAAGWITQLDAQSPLASVLRMRAGLLAPDDAIMQARAQIAKGIGSGWTLLEEAGRMKNDRVIAIEVTEHRLNGSVAMAVGFGRSDGGASALWALYAEAALQVANQAQLLTGDDAAWLAYAQRMGASQPQSARALLGHLAVSGAVPRLKADARTRLLASLRGSKLQRAALELFSDARIRPIDAMEPGLRYELGEMAADLGSLEAATHYWRGMAVPDGMNSVHWTLRKISLFVHAGMPEEALVASGGLDAKQPLPQESRGRLLSIATDAIARAQYRVAERLLTTLLVQSADAERPVVLTALGKCYQGQGDPRAAAAAFLQAALSMAAPGSHEALQAREAAAQALLKAGLRADARAVYEWLSRNAKHQGIRDSASRALRALF